MPSFVEQRGDLDDVVAVAETERGRDRVDCSSAARRRRARRAWCREAAPSARPARARADRRSRPRPSFPCADRPADRSATTGIGNASALREPAGIVLDQRAGAGGADDHRLRLEAVIGVLRRGLEQLGGVLAEVARGERRVGHGRAPVAALDHREQQIRIGVALRRMQHVVQPFHTRGDAHGADMGRAFICPDGELHIRPPAWRGAPADARTVQRDRTLGRNPGSA